MNNVVKDEFKKLMRFTVAPAQYLEVLPSNFEQLLQTTQANQACRAGEVPVRCPLDFLEQIVGWEVLPKACNSPLLVEVDRRPCSLAQVGSWKDLLA